MAKRISSRQSHLNSMARQAGFRNDYHYRQVRARLVAERPFLGNLKGEVARAAIGIRAGTARLAGEKGSRERARNVAIISEGLEKARGQRQAFVEEFPEEYDPELDDYDVGDYWDDVDSPGRQE